MPWLLGRPGKCDGVQFVVTGNSAHPGPRTDATTTGVVQVGWGWHALRHGKVIACKITTGKKKNEVRLLDDRRMKVISGIYGKQICLQMDNGGHCPLLAVG